MTYFIIRLTKPIIICLILILSNQVVKAQVPLLQKTIDKLESYKNFSYQYVYKQKEVFSDTLIYKEKFGLLKMPENKETGYLFRHELKYGDMKLPTTELYDGKSLITLYPNDSTFSISSTKNARMQVFEGSLLANLNWLKTFAITNPSKIAQSNDTVFNSVNSYHLIIITRDTTVNKEHLYIRLHLFIDKATGLPVGYVVRSRGTDFGKEVTDYYTEDSYFNYVINQNNISPDSFAMPEGFHPPKQKSKEETALLTPGNIAPDWILYDSDGKKTSLAQLKGKIVLMDFFFVGCVPCMQTLAPLDRLDEKYKNKSLVMLSISNRDDKKAVATFKKTQHIKNQMYPDGGDVAKLYHVADFPTFYFIDKNGKIASVMTGYSDDFEKKMDSIIEKILRN